MKSYFRYLIGVVSSLLLAGCGGSSQPEPNISQSLKPITSADGSGQVGIQKSALGKDFLLQGNLITQDGIPMFNNLKSRIVFFKKTGAHVAMYESTKNQEIVPDLDMKFLLATFPVVSESDETVIFDFAAGMNNLYIQGDWYASDFQGPDYLPSFQFVPSATSFVEDVRYSKNNELVIHQVSQLPMPSENGMAAVTAQVYYYLSPYVMNEGFIPTVSANMERMGFFEVTPQIINGASKVYASRYDDRKNIVYGISANTPAEFRQAVKDGILYWNKAFGREVFTVVDAPADAMAPDADLNLVQWVNWDDAGFAYADAQMDPLTGEIRHSQIFMTSAFAFVGKERARKLMAGFEKRKAMSLDSVTRADLASIDSFKKRRAGERPIKMVGLKGFTQNHLCMRDETKNIQSAILELSKIGASDDQALKLVQDYIREVVAHEVGHTIGLRHNFAGSLAANFSMSERDDLFKRYATSGTVDADVRTSSSVMEYQNFVESTMSGDLIAKNPKVLDYDQKAVNVLYRGMMYDNSALPLFCTDSLESARADCKVFDSGISPISFGRKNLDDQPENLARLLVQAFVSLKTDEAAMAEGLDFDAFDLDAQTLAMYLNDPRMDILPAFYYDLIPYLKIERSFSRLTSANFAEFLSKSKDYVDAQLAVNGGLTNVMPNYDSQAAEKLRSRVSALVSNEEMLAAMNGGRPFSFSDADKEKIAALMMLWTNGMNAYGVEDEMYFVMTMLNVQAKSGTAFQEAGELVKYKLSAYLLSSNGLAVDGEVKFKKKNGSSKKAHFRIPALVYDADSRLMAVKAYQAIVKMFPNMGAEVALASAKQALTTLAKESLGGYMPADIDPNSVEGPTRTFVTSFEALLSSI